MSKLLYNSLDLQMREILSNMLHRTLLQLASWTLWPPVIPTNITHFLWFCEKKNSNPHKDRKKKSTQETDTLNSMPLFHDTETSFLILYFPYSSKHGQVWVKLKMKSLKVNSSWGKRAGRDPGEEWAALKQLLWPFWLKPECKLEVGTHTQNIARKMWGKNTEKLIKLLLKKKKL